MPSAVVSPATVPGRRWRAAERVWSSRRAQVLWFAGLAVAFAAFRWAERLEPWNSDDMVLFRIAEAAANGQHWLFGASSVTAPPAEFSHMAFRIGLLPVALPAIHAFGASATAYYIVPLLFALVGFGALYWALAKHLGPAVAWLFAFIHVIWPFELEHASIYLTDLPAAACGLVCLCLLDASVERGSRGRFVCTLLAGVAAFETYLLRNNGLVLLAPACLVFLWPRATRRQCLGAGAVAVLGVLALQAVLVARGFSWGYDWSSVRVALAGYAQFLPVYTWKAFPWRQFGYQVSTFGPGLFGYAAALLLGLSLVLHLALLKFERRPLLMAIAVFGLVTWVVFSFSVYEQVPSGVRAAAPTNYRYVQAFAYSSLVVWSWVFWALQRRFAVRPDVGGNFTRWAIRVLPSVAVPLIPAVVPLLLVTFSAAAHLIRLPDTYRQGETRRLVDALEARLGQRREMSVIGFAASVSVPQLFCCSEPAVQWQGLGANDLAERVRQGSQALVLRDIQRELGWARYLPPDSRRAHREQMSQLEDILWRDHELIYVDSKYALFAPTQVSAASSPSAAVNVVEVPASLAPGTSLLTEATCRVGAEDQLQRALVASRTGERPWCEYTWLQDGRVIRAPSGQRTDGSRLGFVLRLRADYEAPLALSVELVEHNGHGVRRERFRLSPGTSYVPVAPGPGERMIHLVYRLNHGGAPDGEAVTIYPAEWRPSRPNSGAEG